MNSSIAPPEVTVDLIASEIRYRRLFESARDGILILDAVTRKITEANAFMIELLGYSHDEFLGKELWEIGLLSDEEASKAAFRELQTTGYIRYEDLPLETKKGERRDVELVSNVYVEGDREVIQCNIRDITERKAAAAAFKRHQQELRILFDLMPAFIWFKDTENRILRVNQNVADSIGMTVQAIEGRPSREIYPELADKFYADDLEVIRTGVPKLGIIEALTDGQGKEFWVQTDKVPYLDQGGNIAGIIVVARDITERKEARDQLEQNSNLLRIASKAARLGGWTINLPERTLIWSDEICAIHDQPPGYLPTLTEGLDHYPPVYRPIVVRHMEECERDGIPYDFEMPKTTATGRQIYIRSMGEAVRDDQGTIIRLQGAMQDITERWLATEASRQKDSLIRIANRVTHTGGWVVEFPQKRVFWSDELCDILQFPRGPAPDVDRALEFYAPSGRERVTSALEECSRLGTPFDLEVEVDTALGNRIWVRVCGEAERSPSGTITRVQGAFQDITERRRAEESVDQLEHQLRQAQKLESVGQLAGGIAHDFNNLLTAISGYSDLTLRRMSADDPLRRNIEEIKKAGDRSAELTYQLLAFSRRQILQPQVLSINDAINDTSRMLERLIGEDIRLIKVLSPQAGQVKVDPGQLSQIIINLAVNARDAMPRGGRLTFETKRVRLGEDFTSRHVDVLPGEYVVLAISDSGCGMSREVQQQVFEPFFTTKEVGKGTGLGLATVYGIVKQSGGNIWVDSEIGVGSTFKIYLPRVTEATEDAETTPTDAELPGGTESILLVEDDAMVRGLTRQVLEMCGYAVTVASNGSEALSVCEQNHEPFDLLLTDVVMPGTGGRELAEQFALINPHASIVFMSGYTDDAVVRHGVMNQSVNFVEKPFTPWALSQKLRSVLDSARDRKDQNGE
jgi:PAS domain S-box-containing protein